MHNFGLIYQYEIKKIIGRKRTVIAFVMVLIATLPGKIKEYARRPLA